MDLPIELPSLFSFPPFFTRQPNAQTYTAQKSAWTSLILKYYRARRIWRIDVNQETIEKVPIFSNRDIQRTSWFMSANILLGKMKLEFLRELVEGMVDEGQAEWVGKGTRVQALLYWLKPEEWANMISNWVYYLAMRLIQIDETGQKNAVLTFYELSQGDLVMKEG
jgi:ESCRT-II complex subunit VPS25